MKLRLTSIVLAGGLASGCQGLGFMNLAMAPRVGIPAVAAASLDSELITYGDVSIVGHYESYNEILAGHTVRSLTDESERVALRLLNTGATCEGTLRAPDDGWPTEWPLAFRNCLNRVARGTLKCSDGRELVLDWRATQCRVAYGEGFDRNGGTLRLEVFDNAETAANRAKMLTAQLSPYPPLPQVR